MLDKNPSPQTTGGSWLESILANVFCFFICWGASYIIYPMYNMDVPNGDILGLSIWFNLLGVFGYWLFRRIFNKFKT